MGHSHIVSVNDPGHTHVEVVNDPGHGHSIVSRNIGGGGSDFSRVVPRDTYTPDSDTTTNKTGITVDTLPAKSAIEVSIDANDAGEHYPLVYVLLCQKLP